jgi:peroxin-3
MLIINILYFEHLGFIRNFVAIHILSLISIFIHIQINMVGRLIYIESVIGESKEDVDQHNTSTPSSVSFETQKQYLSFSWWFVNRGWKSIGIKVQDILARELESISIRERLTYQQLWEIINQLRNKLEYEVFDQKHVILEALMPSDSAGEREVISQLEGRPVPDDYEINPNLRRLLDETKDFIEW